MISFDKGYALVVGIANYPKVNKLPSTVLKDAKDIKAILTNPYLCGYPSDQVKLLIDNRAVAEEIRNNLRWLADEVGPNDTAIFFFSGHGGRIDGGPMAGNYLLPFDVNSQDLQGSAIGSEEFTALLREIKAERLLVLFDCCYSGGTGETKSPVDDLPAFKAGLDEKYYERLGKGKGRVIIASSRSDEVSLVLPEMQNSLFTHYLLKALSGEAKTQGDGLVRIFDVFDFVSDKVKEHQVQQHPVCKAEIETNFPLSLYLGGQKSLKSETLSLENPVTETHTTHVGRDSVAYRATIGTLTINNRSDD